MNGGPGSTSMNALFTENGPLRISQPDPTDNENFEITYTPELSWIGAGDLIFVDMPAGTGWSYGEKTATSLTEIGEDFVTFLQNFYTEFPQYKARELILTGESFAGKYLSYIAKSILDHNDSAHRSLDKINVRTLILSNPLVDVPTERLNQHHLGYSLGMYDDSQSEQVETLRRHCEEAPATDTAISTSAKCKAILNYVAGLGPLGSRNQMDARYFSYDDMPNSHPLNNLFKYSGKLKTLRKELHITKPTRFSKSNSTVADALGDDKTSNAAFVFTDLLKRGL